MIARDDVEDEEPEITLSTASLLGLFVGLVLVCGVFFGFGYSVGRRAATIAGPAAASATDTAETIDHVEAAPRPVKPSGSEIQDAESAAAQPVTLPIVETPPPDSGNDADAVPLPKPSTKAKAVSMETAPIMVQVAAVVRREDADVLLSALRQRGFDVMVRSEPQDKLLHVQVGPFASRVQANATKQKLASAGYNAIIK